MGEFSVVSPITTPSGTRPATQTSDMVKVSSFNNKTFEWHIGTPNTDVSAMRIENLCVSHEIFVGITVPEWLSIPNPSYILAPDAYIDLPVSIKESVALNYVSRNITDFIKITVKPMGVNGPVWVR